MTTEDMTVRGTVQQSGAWAKVAADLYESDGIIEIEDVDPSEKYPNSGRRFRCHFQINNPHDDAGEPVGNDDGSPVTMLYTCSQKFSTGAKPSNLWVLAERLGLNPQPDMEVRMSQFLNRPCKLLINIRSGEGGDRPFIADILAAPKKAGGRAAPAAAPSTATDDLGPCVVCDAPGTAYTGKGKVICDDCGRKGFS